MLKAENHSEKPISKILEFLIFLSIFINSYIFFRYPFEAYLHYPIEIVLIPIFIAKYGYPKFLAKLLLFALVIGGIYIAKGTYPLFDFIKVFGGMFLSFTFYYFVIRHYEHDVKRLFRIYLKWSYVSALIGLIQAISFKLGFLYGYNFRWIFNKWSISYGGIWGLRINSIFMEPSTLAAVLAPAVYVSLYNLIYKNPIWLTRKQSLIIVFIYILTGSSTAYIGVMIILFLLTMSIRFNYILFGVFAGMFLFNVFYNISEDFRGRVDSSKELWVNQNYTIKNTNTSSFVLYNNFHVATEALKVHPLFGTGLGSYQAAYQKHSLTKNKNVIAYDFEFNTTDGNSLFIRMLVETGLVGTLFFMLLIIRGFIFLRKEERFLPYKIISQSIFILFSLNLLRQGNYFLNGFPFFVLLYYYNYKAYLKEKNKELSPEDITD